MGTPQQKFLSGMKSGSNGCVGPWVGAGSTQRNAETQSLLAQGLIGVSGAAVEQRIEARPSMLRHSSCCALRENGSKQESTQIRRRKRTDYAEEAFIDRAKRQTIS
jgi:hypothetical protein